MHGNNPHSVACTRDRDNRGTIATIGHYGGAGSFRSLGMYQPSEWFATAAGLQQRVGFDRQVVPVRSALRRIGVLIRELEEGRA
jgi:hypothetical protein